MKRIRGALGTGLTWAILWAPVAVVVGTQLIDPDDAMDEMWWMVGALPGFLSGVIFSAVLSRVARRQRLDELSVLSVSAWGAVAGFLTGILPFLLGDRGGAPVWPLAITVVSTITVLSALSAAGSLALAQRAHQHDTLGSTTPTSDPKLLGAIATSDPKLLGAAATSDLKLLSTTPTSDPKLLGAIATSDPKLFGEIATSDPKAMSRQSPAQQ